MTFEKDLAKHFTDKTKKIRYGNIIKSILNPTKFLIKHLGFHARSWLGFMDFTGVQRQF